MAQARNLALLKLGVEVWNQWRRTHPDQFSPDLRGANLVEMNLTRADLTGADLRKAEMAGAKLLDADLYMAKVGGADLRGAQGLTDMQIAEALGDEATMLPVNFQRPSHWATASVSNPDAAANDGRTPSHTVAGTTLSG